MILNGGAFDTSMVGPLGTLVGLDSCITLEVKSKSSFNVFIAGGKSSRLPCFNIVNRTLLDAQPKARCKNRNVEMASLRIAFFLYRRPITGVRSDGDELQSDADTIVELIDVAYCWIADDDRGTY